MCKIESVKSTDGKAWRMRRAMLYLVRKNPTRYQMRAGVSTIGLFDGHELLGIIERKGV